MINLLLFSLLLFLPASYISADAGYCPMAMGPQMMGGFGYFGAGLSWFLSILFWILIIWAVIILFRYMFSNSNQKAKGNALEILKERYAKGEITKDEFEQKKKDINL
ncbi:MAG: SHOCT domain-containing protein [Candidatus Pacebacteria bacterium]|nr:SHOCT domain-containing protein [Candidatus Paceibacterota bacterium]